MDSGFTYLMASPAGGRRYRVAGLQVGRFAVRAAQNVLLIAPNGDELVLETGWLVDHVPSGSTAIAVSNGPLALLVADDISRFAEQDPTATDLATAARQCGVPIARWLDAVARGECTVGFREWRERGRGTRG